MQRGHRLVILYAGLRLSGSASLRRPEKYRAKALNGEEPRIGKNLAGVADRECLCNRARRGRGSGGAGAFNDGRKPGPWVNRAFTITKPTRWVNSRRIRPRGGA
jgi:hypothetical protein